MHVVDVFRIIKNTENESEVPFEPCSNYSNPWPEVGRNSDDDFLGK